MKRSQEEDETRQKIADWVPLILIVGGLGLSWLGIDKRALTLHIGFLAYGTLGLADSIRKKYHAHLSLKTLKIGGQLVITILAIENIISGPSSFLTMLLLILMDKLILIPSRLESGDEEKNVDSN